MRNREEAPGPRDDAKPEAQREAPQTDAGGAKVDAWGTGLTRGTQFGSGFTEPLAKPSPVLRDEGDAGSFETGTKAGVGLYQQSRLPVFNPATFTRFDHSVNALLQVVGGRIQAGVALNQAEQIDQVRADGQRRILSIPA
ncbi:hypothetical protein OCOJLMKI_4540 [Methylobacterium iners]|uniref:Uncharacterized protein n=1 Tax=Methylobacterium iners TaxID=418707 RepID=A0ABQ4S2G2_9HYPH|nr:hypothetical protein OCOJLMKI_4540 [Methylobacterium iners]